MTALRRSTYSVVPNRYKPPDKRLISRRYAPSRLEIHSYICALSCTSGEKSARFRMQSSFEANFKTDLPPLVTTPPREKAQKEDISNENSQAG